MPAIHQFVLPKLRTITVWIGAYGGHYDIVVLFRKKPTHYCTDDTFDQKIVNLSKEHEAGNILADMHPAMLQELFPTLDLKPILKNNGRPVAIEILSNGLIKAEIAAPIDEDGDFVLPVHNDWE
jgi:hypothetical protein